MNARRNISAWACKRHARPVLWGFG